MPIAIANVINAATIHDGDGVRTIYLNAIIMLILVLQNIVTNYYHTKLHSYAIRSVESGLRASLIKKLQELSIPYQKEMQSGCCASTIKNKRASLHSYRMETDSFQFKAYSIIRTTFPAK